MVRYRQPSPTVDIARCGLNEESDPWNRPISSQCKFSRFVDTMKWVRETKSGSVEERILLNLTHCSIKVDRVNSLLGISLFMICEKLLNGN